MENIISIYEKGELTTIICIQIKDTGNLFDNNGMELYLIHSPSIDILSSHYKKQFYYLIQRIKERVGNTGEIHNKRNPLS